MRPESLRCDLLEIIVLPVVGGLAEYTNWINVETRDRQSVEGRTDHEPTCNKPEG
jgi:hypothetical protein